MDWFGLGLIIGTIITIVALTPLLIKMKTTIERYEEKLKDNRVYVKGEEK